MPRTNCNLHEPTPHRQAWKKDKTQELVVQALRAGFRGIDTACQPKHYYEPGVGAALAEVAKEVSLCAAGNSPSGKKHPLPNHLLIFACNCTRIWIRRAAFVDC